VSRGPRCAGTAASADSYDHYRRGRERTRKQAEHTREAAERQGEQERENAERGREYVERYQAERAAAEKLIYLLPRGAGGLANTRESGDLVLLAFSY